VQTTAEFMSRPDDDTSTQGSVPTPAPGATTPMPPSGQTQESLPSTPPTAEPPPIMASSLLDLPSVSDDTNSSIDLDDSGTIEIDGATYGRALIYECSLYCDGSSPQMREVTLGRKYARFTATAAVLDTSTGSYRIDVTLDGHPPKTFTTTPGKPARIDLSVAGISRMRIQMYAPGKLKSPLQAGVDAAGGGNGGGLPGIGLGDPLLLPEQ
jgi:hypothetical protein